MSIMAEIFSQAVRTYRDAPAIFEPGPGSQTSYTQLDAVVNRIADACRSLGLRPGDRVGILQRNSVYWVACEAAFAQCGFITVPVNVYLSGAEAGWILNHSGAVAIFFDLDTEPLIPDALAVAPQCRHAVCVPDGTGRPPSTGVSLDEVAPQGVAYPQGTADVRPGDPHRIMYTSATTGAPKGVICPNEMVAGAIGTALANQLRDVRENDRLIATTPLTHVANGFFWAFFSVGLPTVLLRKFAAAEFCRYVAEYGVTHAVMAPTLIADLVGHLRDHGDSRQALQQSPLRAIWYAGSPMPRALAVEAEELLGPILNQQYGFTEMLTGFPALGITELRAADHRRKIGSCGRPIRGAVIRVLDDEGNALPPETDGEVALMLHSYRGGYWNNDDDSQQQALREVWLRTGDIGHFDAEGFLYLRDRKSDMIVTGGLNVYPAEVENVLMDHPAVSRCAVVGVPDERWIEVVHAVVVPRPGANVRSDDVIEYCRERIAHYKCPKYVSVWDELPTSATGKVLRREIRRRLQESTLTDGVIG